MGDAWSASRLGVDTRPPDIPLSAAMVTEAFCTRPATPSPALHQRHLVDDTHQPRARTVFVEDPVERKCMRQALKSEHTVIGWPRSFEAPRTIACLGCDPARAAGSAHISRAAVHPPVCC